MSKRILVGVLVLALALSGLSWATVGAQDDVEARAYLGVRIADTDAGVTVTFVSPGSPADEAGVRVQDMIESVDGTAIADAAQLVEVIQGYAPGDEVTLTISYRGVAHDVTATLAEYPAEQITVEPAPFMFQGGTGERGMRGRLALFGLEINVTDEGIVIADLAEDSPFAAAGLQAGDVVTAVNGKELGDLNLQVLIEAMHATSDEGMVTFTVLRDGESVDVEVDLSELDLPPMAFDIMPDVLPMQPFGRPLQLGVSYQTITPELNAEKELGADEGALVMEVLEETPAAEAGLEAGDIIVAVDGDAVDQEHILPNRLSAYEPGAVVTLTVLRAGEELSLEVELGPRGVTVVPGMQFGMRSAQPGHGMQQRGNRFGQSEMMPGMPYGKGQFFGHMHGKGQSFGNMPGMQQFFEMHPGMGQFFGNTFGMGQSFEIMPGTGFEFNFGPGVEVVPAPAVPDASVTGDSSNPAA